MVRRAFIMRRSMQRLQAGMVVFGISGRRIGTVGVVHKECFEVHRPREDGGDTICLKAEALFTVDGKVGATLVCGKEEVERYMHLPHEPEPAGAAGG